MRLFDNNDSDENFEEYYPVEQEPESINGEFSSEDTVLLPAKPKHRLRRFIIRLSVLCFIVIAINVGVLFFTGKLWFNQPDKNDYPIRGAVVTSDMGDMRWNVFSKQNISAVYIRATTGTSFIDENFVGNWKDSVDCDLLTGAYHVLSLRADGEKQAEYFCNAMGNSLSGRLIPSVEVDLSGLYAISPPEKDETVSRLKEFCDYIEKKYRIKPLIMCKNRCYEKYIKGEFDDYPLWITDVFSKPENGVDWDFWCYNSRVRVKGYENSKEYFSMFVYKDNVDIEKFKRIFVV